jgi:hypothetical protein
MTDANCSGQFAITSGRWRHGYFFYPLATIIIIFHIFIGIASSPSLNIEVTGIPAIAESILIGSVSSSASNFGPDVKIGISRAKQLLPDIGTCLPSPLNGSARNCLSSTYFESQDTLIYKLNEAIEKRPKLLWMKLPTLPESLKQVGEKGKVVLHVLVDQLGRTTESKIFSEMPADRGLGQRAISAVKTAVFIPGVNKAKLVKCWTELTLEL